jgi:DnaJ-class molecular chaperone
MTAIDQKYCPHCLGSGKVFCAVSNDPSEREQWHVCPECGGDGMAKFKEFDPWEADDDDADT